MRTADAQSVSTKIGRNDLCPCGSGRKHKKCCYGKYADAQLFDAAPAMPPHAKRRKAQALRNAANEHWRSQRYAAAALPLYEITSLTPDSPQAHYELGLCLLKCGRLTQAVASLKQALQLKPGFVEALTQLALAVERVAEPEALLAYRKLVRMADNAPDRMFFSAKVLALEGKLEEAEEKLRRLIALAPERPGTRMILAKMLLERGLFESAEIELLQLIDTFPDAFERLTSTRHMSQADRPLIERMQALADSAAIGFEDRIAVSFGLGKAFDDLGDYAQAIRHYDVANSLRAATIRLDRQGVVRAYDETIARHGKDMLDGAAARLVRSPDIGGELPVFIVGMPRSGTTLIEQILSSHPAVAGAGELPFWQNQLAAWPLSRDGLPDAAALWKATGEYLAILRGFSASALRVTNKQPQNFELLWLIHLAFPEARIIHCRRNPVDTCLSIYFSSFSSQQDYAFDRGDLVFQYRQYERLMEHWRRVLPHDRFTEIDYEMLVADREAQTRKLLSFLGLDWDDACLAPEQNQRPVKTASVWQTRQPVYTTSVGRWRNYEPRLQELRELLPEPTSTPVKLSNESNGP